SLREAIIATNNTPNGAVADEIILAAGTYLLNQGSGDDTAHAGDLDINDDLTITGAGARTTIIDGNGLDRVFHIKDDNTATISGITVRGGDQGNGGGIFVDTNSTLYLADAFLTGNNHSGAGSGGAIHVHGTAHLDRVLMSGNTADHGGAIGFHNTGGGSLTNVTISGNTATGEGGGLWTDVPITVTNSTIAFNTAPTGGGMFVDSGGDVTLTNSILHNPGSDNSNAALTSGGFNIDSDGTAGLGDSLDNTDPLLNPLADNGGPSDTHSLQAASQAIDPAGLTGAPAVDQRGVARDATPDIG
ncbi:MAG: hypothetical protein GY736_22345, partial [Sphingomonas sp.]|uniref:choice-of-anchor Q domain-containing protein n=1 Tax=Sphingomonas sp. TaxID=28214 RepID=UPI002586576A